MAQINDPLMGEILAFDDIHNDEIKFPPQNPDDIHALKIVVQDVSKAESKLQSQNYPQAWDDADRLYAFRVPQQFWEGTRVPRASLGIPLCFQHIDSIHPNLMMNLFEDSPPFDVEARHGTDPDAGRAVKAVIGWEVDHANIEEEMDKGTHEMLHLGTCIFKYGWCVEEAKYYTYDRTGADSYGETERRRTDAYPTFEHIELRHILIDPSLREPDIRKAKWVAHRIYLNGYQLRALKADPTYNLPSETEILSWFKTPEELAKTSTIEGKSWDLSPEFESASRDEKPSIDPLMNPLEIIEYWTNEYSYTVLQRKRVIRKMKNEWKQLPFLSSFYKRVPGQFYGMGITSLIGNEQRLQQGVVNNYLDKLSLDTSGMWGIVQGKNVPTQNIRVRPGASVIVSEKDAIFPLQQTQVNPALLDAVDRSDARAEKWTANNDFIQGSVPEGGSGITRTAKGVSSVSAAAGVRIEQVVKTFGRQVFTPLLEAFHYLNRKNKLKPSIIKRILNEELGEADAASRKDPVEVVAANIDFIMLAGTRMRGRKAMQDNLMNFDQFFMQEPVQAAITDNMQVFDFNEFINMHMEAFGWKNKGKLIRSMDEEEKAKMMSENPMVQQLMAQQQELQMRTNMDLQKIEAENAGRMARDIVKDGLKDENRKSEMSDRLQEEAGRSMATGVLQRQMEDDYDGSGSS